MIDGEWISKFILRVAALLGGVPPSIALRRKVPFNEGGTGTANDASDRSELQLARRYLGESGVLELVREHSDGLTRLGIANHLAPWKELSSSSSAADHLSFYASGIAAGLGRLLRGNTFRKAMPDALYTSVVGPRNRIRSPRLVMDSADLLMGEKRSLVSVPEAKQSDNAAPASRS